MLVAEQQTLTDPPMDPSLIIRHRGAVDAIVPVVSRAVAEVDAGLPIVSMSTMNARLAMVTELETLIVRLLACFAVLSLVIAALGGHCVGGGLEIALACDLRVAAPHAQLGLTETSLAIIPGAGGTQRLPRAVGKAKAMDMVLTGRMMDAAEAERAGLVSRVVPADKLLSEAVAAAEAICAMSGPSVAMAKEAVNRAFEGSLSDGVMFERRLFHSLFATADQKEGMDAFLNKRKPDFQNR
mgnify:CR=1 FL=1